MVRVEIIQVVGLGADKIVGGAWSAACYANRLGEFVQFLEQLSRLNQTEEDAYLDCLVIDWINALDAQSDSNQKQHRSITPSAHVMPARRSRVGVGTVSVRGRKHLRLIEGAISRDGDCKTTFRIV